MLQPNYLQTSHNKQTDKQVELKSEKIWIFAYKRKDTRLRVPAENHENNLCSKTHFVIIGHAVGIPKVLGDRTSYSLCDQVVSSGLHCDQIVSSYSLCDQVVFDDASEQLRRDVELLVWVLREELVLVHQTPQHAGKDLLPMDGEGGRHHTGAAPPREGTTLHRPPRRDGTHWSRQLTTSHRLTPRGEPEGGGEGRGASPAVL